ncbi:MAG: hypothetical protein GC161_17100 [Planctomycetaceae bacterium]|nr:hypothetical protein [Planctomycetaceae bacterium]
MSQPRAPIPAHDTPVPAAAADLGGRHVPGPWVGSDAPSIWTLIARVPAFPRKVLNHRDLVLSSIIRELRARFQGTLLGWMWPLVYPIFMFAVYYFIFAELLQMKMPGITDDQKPAMGIFMFVGVLIWTGFAEGMLRAGNVIVENGNLIKKLAFPTELLPFNVTVVGLTTMLFGVGIYLAVLWGSVGLHAVGLIETPLWPDAPGLGLLWMPVLLLVQLMFTVGIGLLLATMQVFLRDTMQLASILTLTWMFVTPVFWVASPQVIGGIEPYMDTLALNPALHLLNCWRWVLMVGQPAVVFDGQPAFLESLGTISIWAVCLFVVGYLFFLRSQRRFADEV